MSKLKNILFTCPACEEQQNEFLESQSASIIWKHCNEFTEAMETINGETETFLCANCHNDIPRHLVNKFL